MYTLNKTIVTKYVIYVNTVQTLYRPQSTTHAIHAL